ncbi:hypothetical protein IQ25_04188 [Novosphingobium taihuense]|nr:hypothetical protein IQ25_04188 [Novosphingobium taihuense]
MVIQSIVQSLRHVLCGHQVADPEKNDKLIAPYSCENIGLANRSPYTVCKFQKRRIAGLMA